MTQKHIGRSGRSTLRELAATRASLQMTPMIDVTFLLLIFFMSTLRFRSLEGRLDASLPKDVGIGLDIAPEENLQVSMSVVTRGVRIRPDGNAYTEADGVARRRFVYGAGRTLEYRFGPRTSRDLRDVEAFALRVHQQRPQSSVTIDPRVGVTNGEVVQLFDRLVGVGFVDVRFTASEEPE